MLDRYTISLVLKKLRAIREKRNPWTGLFDELKKRRADGLRRD